MVINEIFADPAADLSGDANGDGTRDSTDDEFVELVNDGAVSVDLSGWRLSDGAGVKHTFSDGAVVPPGAAVVIFGGGIPSGSFGGALVFVATGLGLNNTGDTVTLNDGSVDVASYSYGSEGNGDESLTRDLDVTGAFVPHSTASGSNGALFSPGTRVDGTSFVPEPSCLTLVAASLGLALRRRRS